MGYNYTNIFTIRSIEIEINRLGNTKKIFTVPNTYNAIANIAFSNQTELEEVILPRSINWIGIDAFHNCINLKKITILNSDCVIKTYFLNTLYSTIFKNITKFIAKKYDEYYYNPNNNQIRDRYFIQFLKDINEDKNNIIKYITVGAISFEDIAFLLDENEYNGFKNGVKYGI